MSSEWYDEDLTTEVENRELKLIQKGVNQHLIPIIVEATGELEAFDRYGAEATIYNEKGESTGIKLAHAVYGEPEFWGDQGEKTYEQIYRITFGEEYVSILLNHDGTIKKIQKNFKENSTYTVNEWLENAYAQTYNITDNYKPYFNLGIREFRYHGEEETRQIQKLNKSLRR